MPVKERLTVGRVQLMLRVTVLVDVVEKECVEVPVWVAPRVRDGVAVSVGLREKEPEDRVGETQLGLEVTLGVREEDRDMVQLRVSLNDSEWVPVRLWLEEWLGLGVPVLTERVGVHPLGLRLALRETARLTLSVNDGCVSVPVRDQLGLAVGEPLPEMEAVLVGPLPVGVPHQVARGRWARVMLTVRLWVLVGPLRDHVGVPVAVGVRVRVPVTTDGLAV